MKKYFSITCANGFSTNIPIRRSNRAKQIILRVVQEDPGIELVIPIRASIEQGENFTKNKSDWIYERLKERPTNIPIRDGIELPYLDEKIILYFISAPSPSVAWLGNKLLISGPNINFDQLALKALKMEAEKIIKPSAEHLASLLNKTITNFHIGDPKTRWGSCSSIGRLSFSWRLIMSPKKVLNYVICHEVSHLAELNHGPKFWKLVNMYSEDAPYAKAWLKLNGDHLRKYSL